MSINETNLLVQLKKHNEKALLYVIEQYGGLLNSIVKKHLYGFPDRQEECLNDIFLAIWKNINSFDERKNTFKNWAAGIARYKSLDYLRIYLKDLQNVSLDHVNDYYQSDSAQTMIEQEISEEMEQMLSCLKPSDRDLFLKLFYEDKEIDEISRETGVKKEVLYNRISRGKKRIRQHYLKGKAEL